MRRRVSWLALGAALGLLGLGTVAMAQDVVRLYAGERLVRCEPPARVHQGVVYAPLRAAAEAVGAHVTWDARARQAVVCTDTQCVPVRAAQGLTVNGALLLPVRQLGQALGREVQWDAAARAVRIKSARKGLL